jgi:ABC-type sugar transport system permease subunit
LDAATSGIILLFLVFAYPILRAFWLSLFTQNLGTQLKLVFSGLDNYGRMISDGRFWQSMWNTTVFTAASVLLELIIGMGVALVLKPILQRTWHRADNFPPTLGFANCLDGTGLGMDF